MNFTDTPTASWITAAQVSIEVPNVSITTATPAIYQDEQVENHNASAADPPQADNLNNAPPNQVSEQVFVSPPPRGRTVTFDSSVQSKSEVMSRLSDSNTRISALENSFESMSFSISEAIDELKRQATEQTRHHRALDMILAKLYPQEFAEAQAPMDSVTESLEPEGEQSSTSSFQANPLNPSYEAGDSEGATGHGS